MSDPTGVSDVEGVVGRLVGGIRSLLDSVPFSAEEREKFRVALRLLNLFPFYMKETTKCFAAEAYFSANIMGAATLETVLLLRCIFEEEHVCKTRAWQFCHKGKKMLFLKKLGKMDLATLLSIGEERSWFSQESVPEAFKVAMAEHFGPAVTAELCKLIPQGGQLSAHVSHDFRNQVHPAKCSREAFALNDPTGMFASLCLMAAFSSFVEQVQMGNSGPQRVPF